MLWITNHVYYQLLPRTISFHWVLYFKMWRPKKGYFTESTLAGLSTHLSQPSHNIWASLAWDNLCFHKFQVGEMVYIYKNLKGSYFYHFLTLKTFQPFSTSKRRSSVSSQKWRQRLKKWCLVLGLAIVKTLPLICCHHHACCHAQ